MREDPGLDTDAIDACLHARYGIRSVSITFLPIGYDLRAAVYKVVAGDGASYFLKIRSGPIDEPSLQVPRALIDLGIRNILAPLRTHGSDLCSPLDGYAEYSVVLYPFVRGENAMVVGMSADQWREFGSTLRAVHASGLGEHFRGQLRTESFTLPSAAVVRQLLSRVDRPDFESDAAGDHAAFWRAQAERIRNMLDRAEELGRALRSKPFALVLCHADIHAANILVGDDGRIWLIDWDGPLIAPRERDLLFVVGSTIARSVEPREEEQFFDGYGPAEIDPAALVYYRYERIIEDLGEIGKRLLLDPNVSERARRQEAELAMSFFAPGGDIDRAERVEGCGSMVDGCW